MRTILLLMLFIPSLSLAQQNQCANIFDSVTIVSKDTTQGKIRQMIVEGKNSVRDRSFKAQDKEFFKKILELKKDDVSLLSPPELLEIYELFAKWNLVPPKSFQNLLFLSLFNKLSLWTARDVLQFALSRKLSPLEPPKYFLKAWKSLIVKRFSEFNAVTQMEVLGAELFHKTFFSSKELIALITMTTESLKASHEIFRLKPLKELYRGLRFLRGFEPTLFFNPIVKLEIEINRHLSLQGLSLDQDGRSGDTRPKRAISWRQAQFETHMAHEFTRAQKMEEYSNPNELGFFDPVDLFYPSLRLIVEWDGPHHYFNSINSQGEIGLGINSLTLRPFDQLKDELLRAQGYYILRIPKELNEFLNHTTIRELIEQQNPNFLF